MVTNYGSMQLWYLHHFCYSKIQNEHYKTSQHEFHKLSQQIQQAAITTFKYSITWIQSRIWQENQNWIKKLFFAHNAPSGLFARVMVLIPDAQQTFSLSFWHRRKHLMSFGRGNMPTDGTMSRSHEAKLSCCRILWRHDLCKLAGTCRICRNWSKNNSIESFFPWQFNPALLVQIPSCVYQKSSGL